MIWSLENLEMVAVLIPLNAYVHRSQQNGPLQKFAQQLLWSVAIQIWSGCICSVLHQPLQAPQKSCWPQKMFKKDATNMSNLIKFVVP